MKSRGRDSPSSTVAGASILASLSTYNKRLSRLPPSKGNEEDSNMGSLSGASDNGICDVYMNDSMDFEELNDASLNPKEAGPASDEHLNVDDLTTATALDTEEAAIPGTKNNELRPLLQLLARTTASDFDFSGSLSKLLEEQRQLRELLKDLERPTIASTRRQTYKEALRRTILLPTDIDVSLENFPYYLRLVMLLLINLSIVLHILQSPTMGCLIHILLIFTFFSHWKLMLWANTCF